MVDDPMQAFFELHKDLPREGPGETADIQWAANIAGLSQNAQMADVGCVVAFSEVCWFTDTPSDRARALWEADGYVVQNEAGIADQIDAAGYEVLGRRRLSDAAWEAYYGPLDARIAALRPGADDALPAVLDEAEEEAACWRAHRDEFGYLLHVVRPK